MVTIIYDVPPCRKMSMRGIPDPAVGSIFPDLSNVSASEEGETWGGGNFRVSQVSWYIYVCRLRSGYTNKNH